PRGRDEREPAGPVLRRSSKNGQGGNMQTKRSYVTAIALLAVLMIPVRLVQAQHKDHEPPKYYVFSLGDPGGGDVAAAASINNIGWIAGDAYQAGNTTEHAELWLGTPFDLETLGGPNSAV